MPRKLNAGMVRQIRERGDSGEKPLAIAAAFKISANQVRRVLARESWGWVPERGDPQEDTIPDHAKDPHWVYGVPKKVELRKKRERRARMRKAAGAPLDPKIVSALKSMTDDRVPDIIVLEIRRLSDEDWPPFLIARRFNLYYPTVYAIAVGKTYKHVT